MDSESTQPIPTPAEPISPQLAPSPCSFNPLLILVAIILLVLMGVGGIFLGKSLNTSKKSAQPTASPTSSVLSTPTPDLTVYTEGTRSANWKTVLESQVGISFKYPEDLLPYTNTPQTTPDHSFFGFDAFNNKEKRDHRALLEADLELELIVYKPASGSIQPYLSVINAANGTIITQPFPGISGSYVKVKTLVEGSTRKAVVYTEPQNEYAEYDAIVVDGDNNIATIRLMTGSHTKKQELLSLLDQILSTFKFLDQNQGKTSSWKKYNTKIGNFSYPSNWQIEEKNIEDTQTVLIKKGDGDSIYNTTIYLGSPFIFSTSGAIAANEPYYGKIGKISFAFSSKNYSADIVELGKYKDGKPINEKYYRFQVSPEESPLFAITVQFLNLSDKDTISQILSTFKFTSP